MEIGKQRPADDAPRFLCLLRSLTIARALFAAFLLLAGRFRFAAFFSCFAKTFLYTRMAILWRGNESFREGGIWERGWGWWILEEGDG